MDAGILNVSFSLRSEFLAEVGRVLVLNVFDDWVPASVVVHLVAVAWGVHDIQPQTNSILLNDV